MIQHHRVISSMMKQYWSDMQITKQMELIMSAISGHDTWKFFILIQVTMCSIIFFEIEQCIISHLNWQPQASRQHYDGECKV